MLSKCVFSDKLHLCTSSNKLKGPLNSRCNEEVYYEAILPLISEDSKLKDLFLKWCLLGPKERATIDRKLYTQNEIDLYTPLKKAMSHWESVQDTQGAPGFEHGMYSFSCNSQLEEELVSMVIKLDKLVKIVKAQSKIYPTTDFPEINDKIFHEDTPILVKKQLGKNKLHRSASVGSLLSYY